MARNPNQRKRWAVGLYIGQKRGSLAWVLCMLYVEYDDVVPCSRHTERVVCVIDWQQLALPMAPMPSRQVYLVAEGPDIEL